MTDGVTVLCTGDIHLGRHPTRIPEEVDGQPFSPRVVWRETVETAIHNDVDAVLISGDVVDRENRYYEAYGAFEAGATRLDEAGIPTLLVAGNHDFDVLSQLVSDLDLDHLTVLGADGEWERHTIRADGEPLVHIDGWSFTNEHVLESPFDRYELPNATDAAVFGLVHADLDVGNSQYAPVTTRELLNSPADAWVLGHIHKPGIRNDSEPFVFYPGTPQPLDPGEGGAHGPWILEYDSTTGIEAEQLPLASVRYDRLSVDASGLEDPKGILPLVSDRIDDHVRTEVDGDAVSLLLSRIQLTGRTQAHGEVVKARASIEDQLSFKKESVDIRVERLQVDTEPEVELTTLADGDTPVAYLAELLLALEGDDRGEEYSQLVDDALDAVRNAHGATTYTPLRREGLLERPDEDDATERLREQARLPLHTLIEQKSEAHHG